MWMTRAGDQRAPGGAGTDDHSAGPPRRPVHARHRGRVSDRAQRDARAALVREPAPRGGQDERDPSRARAARDAPVGGGDGDGHLPGHPAGAGRDHRAPRVAARSREEGGPLHRRRRHAPLQRLEEAGDHRRRPLQEHRRGPAGRRAREPDLRPPRARGHQGPRHRDGPREPGPVLPPPHPRPLDELAVLARPEQRPEEHPRARSSSASPARGSRGTSPRTPRSRATSTCW